MNRDLTSYILIFKDVISRDVCNSLVEELESLEWVEHQYYDNISKKKGSIGENFFTTGEKTSKHDLLMDNVEKAIGYYIDNYKFFWFYKVSAFSGIKYNQYKTNAYMKEHWDGIQSLFDGERKGVPTLSILGSLNDNFTGGELIFFKDQEIKLSPGSIMVFPSTFLYPHKVQPVKEGTRYSFVSWAW